MNFQVIHWSARAQLRTIVERQRHASWALVAWHSGHKIVKLRECATPDKCCIPVHVKYSTDAIWPQCYGDATRVNLTFSTVVDPTCWPYLEWTLTTQGCSCK
jgi:hypothetical protein